MFFSLRRQAVSVEADCVEAIYNLGLVNKRLGQWEDALVAFKKLHSFLPESLEVLFQIGSVYDLLGDSKQSVKWFELLHSRVPYDPGVLARLGAVHSKMEDEAKALHYYSESHRVYPVNMDVICWCGSPCLVLFRSQNRPVPIYFAMVPHHTYPFPCLVASSAHADTRRICALHCA